MTARIHRHGRNRLVALVGLSAIALGAGLPAGSLLAGSDDGTDGTVVVDSPGDQANTITLPPDAAVGQTASWTMGMNMEMSVSGVGDAVTVPVALEMDTIQSVTEVIPEGGYVEMLSIDRVEITDAPEGADPATFPCGSVNGLELEETFNAAGATVSVEPVSDDLTDAEQECVASFTDSTSTVALVYPAEPVGVGAEWSSNVNVDSQGITIPVTYHYTLTDSGDDGTYSVEVTFDADIDGDIEGAEATGTMTGSGTFTGDIDNPLVVNGTVAQTIDMTIDDDGEQADMSIDITIDIDSD